MAGWFSNLSLDQLGAQVSGLTQSLSESVTKIGEDLQQSVNTLAAFDLEDIGKAIQTAEEDITSEEAKIQREEAGLKQAEVKILPWETRIEKLAILSHGLMERVLSLSLEESNFTTPPPGAGGKPEATQTAGGESGGGGKGDAADQDRDTAAAFQLDRHINVAIKMLSLDPNLAKMHARLISHMPEKTFWYHYFSRIGAFRAEVDLEPLCEDLSEEKSGTTTSEEYDKVSHGDAQSMTSPSETPEKTEPKSASDKGGVPEEHDEDDFSDLGDLGDLDGDSDSSIDAALEAEIAAELGEG